VLKLFEFFVTSELRIRIRDEKNPNQGYGIEKSRSGIRGKHPGYTTLEIMVP
jgi:hypothetical protein